MTHLPTYSHVTLRRSLASLATAAALTLLGALGTGCLQPPEADSGSLFADLPEVSCSGLEEWAQNTVYPAGTRVTDTGDAFESRSAHTAFGIDWNPKRAGSLWVAVGTCADGGGGQQPPVDEKPDEEQPDEEQPDEEQPDEEQPPANPPAAACAGEDPPGPAFDPAGEKNVGNGIGQQFIGGQCLSSADCASGCCALPCGICSGPGAQFQNGKLGCGFGD